MAKRHVKRRSTLLITGEMQVKPTPNTGHNGIIKKSTNNDGWRGCGEKGTLLHCWRECKLWRPVWRLLKKLNIELPYDLAISLLGIHTEEPEFEETLVPQCSLQHCL